MRNSFPLLCLLFFILFSSCGGNRLDIDVSNVKMEPVKIKRFEKDLFSGNLSFQALGRKYPDFFQGFVETVPGICPNGAGDPTCMQGIRSFISDKEMRAAYETAVKEYPDLNDLETGLTDVFKHFKYYFPSREIPSINSMMSGYNFHFLRLDKSLGIGLEMYLGESYEPYAALQLPKYKTQNMTRVHMLADFVRAWLMTEFEEKNSKVDFLTRIIKEGKIMYLMDAVLPKMEDSLKMGYSGKQLSWCKRNEGNIWSYFIKRKVLYSTDLQDITQFTNEGPFTTGFAKESPARTGSWIGWQIVRAYMEKNKKMTIPQLMEENDAQILLSKASYKPKL
jgi:hypothetical protein